MMKNLINRQFNVVMAVVLLSVIIAFTLSMFSCKLNDGGNDKDDETPDPPQSINCERALESNDILVSWTDDRSDLTFDLYRIENGSETLIAEDYDGRTYYDDQYGVGSEINYNVRARCHGHHSIPTCTPTCITINEDDLLIADLRVSRLTENNCITISWQDFRQYNINPLFRIRRYTARGNHSNDLASDNPDAVINSYDMTLADDRWTYEDNDVDLNKAYYYVVDWTNLINNNFHPGSQLCFGITSQSDEIYYENNNDWASLPAGSTAFPRGTELILYSFSDDGITDEDTDWYSYSGPPADISVTVHYQNLGGLARVDFLYHDTEISGGVLPQYIDEWAFSFPVEMFTDFNTSEDDGSLYIKISCIEENAIDFFEKYQLAIQAQ